MTCHGINPVGEWWLTDFGLCLSVINYNKHNEVLKHISFFSASLPLFTWYSSTSCIIISNYCPEKDSLRRYLRTKIKNNVKARTFSH